MRPFFFRAEGGPPGSSRRAGTRRTGRMTRGLAFETLELRSLLSGTFTPLTSLSPSSTGTMMLESDGSILVQGGGVSKTWYHLVPNSSGSYVNGTWNQLASMRLARLYFGSNVLADGRVFVMGGEYSGPSGASNFTNTGEIYNPVTNTWANIANFPNGSFGDDPTAVLPNGNILTGYLSGAQTYIYNPSTNVWTQAGTKLRNDRSDEEGWVKLPDGSVLSYDIFSSNSTGVGHAQRYIPSSNTWVDAGIVPVLLSSGAVGSELGPGLLLPDGRVLYLGANGNTAYYTPSTNSWTAGPVIPGGLAADDAPGAVLPDGKVLFTADTPLFNGPAHIFEFDPVSNTYTDLTSSLPSSFLTGPSYVDRMVVLPTGQVLLTNSGSQLYVYTPDLPPVAAGNPTISGIAENGDGSFLLSGTLLNGISEGASYGDDAEMSSNYPIVRFTDPSNGVFYARTYGWSSTGVATGTTPETTNFALPIGIPPNTYAVSVIANGFASDPVSLTIPTVPDDPAPTVAVAASATPNPVDGTTAVLSVLGADTAGESTLSYTWRATTVPAGTQYPSFSVNGTNAAKTDTVTFHRAGTYTFQVTFTNLAGLSNTSSVTVVVDQTLTSITVTPSPVNVDPNATRQLTATAFDQFGNSMSPQPTFTWTLVSGGGTLSSTGLYTAPSSGTLAVVRATAGGVSATASVFVLSRPWLTQDVGTVGIAGAAGDNSNGTYTVLGAGADISGTADAFRFAYQTLTGDGAIVARVASEQNTNGLAKAGVMIRNNLTAGAFEASMVLTPSNGVLFQYRNSTTTTTIATTAGPTVPYWVMLVRSGNLFTGYYSTNGVNWTAGGSATIAMGTTVDIGLAVTSHNTAALNTSTFDNVAIDQTPTVAIAASATPDPVNGTTTNLSVLGADIAGESTLSYTWSTTSKPAGAPDPTFSVNGTNAAKNSVATFSESGQYMLTVTITNQAGLSITSSVIVIVQPATIAAITTSWGTAGTSPLVTDADGIRLLAPGRTNDLAWQNIDQFQVTLSQTEPLSAADVQVLGTTIANYGPVTISPVAGSNTTYTIILALPIAAADRVTLTIGNAMIGTFTRRLDVLPGDYNDDGYVTSADVVAINGVVMTTIVNADLNGDGIVDINDMKTARQYNGTTLPTLS